MTSIETRESLLLGLALSWLDVDSRFHDTTITEPGNELWDGFVATAAKILRSLDLTRVDAVFGEYVEHLATQREFEGDPAAWCDSHGWPLNSWPAWEQQIQRDVRRDLDVLLGIGVAA